MRLTFFKTQFPLLFPAKRHVRIGIYWENSKGGLIDTMKDLQVNCIGAIAFSIIGREMRQ